MIIHRYLFAHYRQVSVFYWPVLFWYLLRVDRWCAETGRQAFVQVDRYGRAWMPYFEGMGRNYLVHDLDTRFYAPSDVQDLCPQMLQRALSQIIVCRGFEAGCPVARSAATTAVPDQVRHHRAWLHLEPG